MLELVVIFLHSFQFLLHSSRQQSDYQLKHLTLRNRIMTTSHEPAYGEDGMPKDRYRLYHLERAKAGVAMSVCTPMAMGMPPQSMWPSASAMAML